MKTTIISVVLIIVTLAISNVNCDKEEDEQAKLTKKIFDCQCADDERDKDFYKCFMKCQGMNPYNLKKDTECNKEARNNLYSKPELDQKVSDKICNKLGDYGDELKKVVCDLKGEVKKECDGDDALEKCFDDKLKCFKDCCKIKD